MLGVVIKKRNFAVRFRVPISVSVLSSVAKLNKSNDIMLEIP